jgi:4-oxalocrotonate tautomerase
MPIIDVTLLEGRSHEQKQKLVAKITDAAVEALGAPRDAVRIILREVPKHHFAVGGVFKAPPPEEG